MNNMSSSEKLNLDKMFDGSRLGKKILESYEAWIRFEIGPPCVGTEFLDKYIQFVYIRSALIFEEIFDPNDDIYVIAETYYFGDSKEDEPKNILLEAKREFNQFIKNKNILSSYSFSRIVICDEEDGYEATYRSVLNCKVNDINHRKLLRGIGNLEMGLSPTFDGIIIIINKTKDIAYFLYDDRGLDVVSKDIESLRGIYIKYNKWILDYDRKAIDYNFSL